MYQKREGCQALEGQAKQQQSVKALVGGNWACSGVLCLSRCFLSSPLMCTLQK